MKYKIVLGGFFLLFTIVSCYTYNGAMREAKPHFTNRFKNESINDVHSKININGYYSEYSLRKTTYGYGKQKVEVDSSASHMVFFEDGTFATTIFFDKNATDSEISANMNRYVTKINHKGIDYWVANWGIYRIEKDTIIIQVFYTGALAVAYRLYEYKYKIINQSTLKSISYQRLPLYAVDYNEQKPPQIVSDKEFSLSKFIPADSLPPSDNFLKKEKWLWENERDWKIYMDSLKEREDRHKRK